MAGRREVQANWISLKYTLSDDRNNEIPNVKQVNSIKIGKNNKDSQPISKPKININIINGIIVNNRLKSAEIWAPKGKEILLMFIDLKTPELPIIDSITWIVDVEKNVQKTIPVRAYNG